MQILWVTFKLSKLLLSEMVELTYPSSKIH